MIQNAHDSIQLRIAEGSIRVQGTIEIFSDPKAQTLTFIDNGTGMSREDIEEFLSTIGRSGTGERTREMAQRNVAVETIGQFGIGLLSAFVVAEKIEVFTRKVGSDQVWHWQNQGNDDYNQEIAQQKKMEIGTEVIVTIGADHRSHLDAENVPKTIKKYADLIPFNIKLNGNGPINAVNAPWYHRNGYFLSALLRIAPC